MYISELEIRNFRNFEKADFKFNPRFTVFIGNNGLGKTAVLKAVQVGLGAILQSIPTLPSRPTFRRQFKKEEQFKAWSELTKSLEVNPENTRLTIKLEIDPTDFPKYQYTNEYYPAQNGITKINWIREYMGARETSHNKMHSLWAIRYGEYLYDAYKNGESVLPVIVSFNTGRVKDEIKKIGKVWLKMSRLERGYYSSLNDTVNFESVNTWLHNYDGSIEADDEFSGTREAFYNALTTAFGSYLKDIKYNRKFEELMLTLDFGDGEKVRMKPLSMCSEGIIGFTQMVAEIAYRCVMLNGRVHGLESVNRSNGVVLIDEIDMLLHPNWQRHVVSDLMRAFPKIQFIATTHSPFIVQSLESDQLWNLDEPVEAKPNMLNLNNVATAVMDVESEFSITNQKKFEEIMDAALNEIPSADPYARAIAELYTAAKNGGQS